MSCGARHTNHASSFCKGGVDLKHNILGGVLSALDSPKRSGSHSGEFSLAKKKYAKLVC